MIGRDTFRKMIVKQVNSYDNTFQQKLEEIDLSYNQLIDIEFETFSQLNSLKILYLRGNLVKLKYGLFPLNLKKLDLSYNNLTNFSLKQLVNSQLLEELILNGNKLSNENIEQVFPEAIFQLMKNIHKFELSDCLTCSTLADLLAQFKRANRNIIVQYETEKLNGSNIFGVSCDDVVDNKR
jgi:Leucine-rich repeat (LRR) protein